MKEFFQLQWIGFKFQWFCLLEYLKTIFKYYRYPKFMLCDIQLLLKYFWKGPFQISKEYLQKVGASNIYAYGETPLTTLDAIMAKAKVSSNDTVYELGCGRGRGVFWLNLIKGCKVVGIEWVPEFIAKAVEVKDQKRLKGVEFRREDMTQTDFKGATVVYLHGTCLEEDVIDRVSEKLSELPAGVKVITVSYPLIPYAGGDHFEVMHRFPVSFAWGLGDVYIQVRK